MDYVVWADGVNFVLFHYDQNRYSLNHYFMNHKGQIDSEFDEFVTKDFVTDLKKTTTIACMKILQKNSRDTLVSADM
jgi:hypothetical protein